MHPQKIVDLAVSWRFWGVKVLSATGSTLISTVIAISAFALFVGARSEALAEGFPNENATCLEQFMAPDFDSPSSSISSEMDRESLSEFQFGMPLSEHFYSKENDTVLLGPGEETVSSAGDGNDTIFVVNPSPHGNALGENGSDTIHVCSLVSTINLIGASGGEMAPDSVPDLIVIHPSAFTSAEAIGTNQVNLGGRPIEIYGARIMISGFDARADRIILRSPTSVAPEIVEDSSWRTLVQAGPIQLDIQITDETAPHPTTGIKTEVVQSDPPGTLELLAVVAEQTVRQREDHGAMVHSSDEHAEHGHDDHHDGDHAADPSVYRKIGLEISRNGTCASIRQFSERDTAEVDPTPENHDARESTWLDGDDQIVHFGDGQGHELLAGGGDDQLWLYDVAPDSALIAGRGSDLVVLCSVEDIDAGISLGNGDAAMDEDPDTLVIAEGVLADIPEGFFRRVSVSEFQPETDRLILPPAPFTPVVEPSAGGYSTDITYGPLLVRLYHGNVPDSSVLKAAVQTGVLPPEPLLNDIEVRKAAIQVVPAEKLAFPEQSWSNAKTLAGTTPDSTPPSLVCDESSLPASRASPENLPNLDEHTALQVRYGGQDETVILKSIDEDSEHGILSHSSIDLGAGNDTAYVFTGNGSVTLGPGNDVAILCQLDGLSIEFIAAPDGVPDTVIIDSGVFLTPVITGLKRRIAFSGFGDSNDRLILRVPEGARIEWVANVLNVTVGDHLTTISPSWHPMHTAPDQKLDENKIIVWPVSRTLE